MTWPTTPFLCAPFCKILSSETIPKIFPSFGQSRTSNVIEGTEASKNSDFWQHPEHKGVVPHLGTPKKSDFWPHPKHKGVVPHLAAGRPKSGGAIKWPWSLRGAPGASPESPGAPGGALGAPKGPKMPRGAHGALGAPWAHVGPLGPYWALCGALWAPAVGGARNVIYTVNSQCYVVARHLEVAWKSPEAFDQPSIRLAESKSSPSGWHTKHPRSEH